MGVLSMGDFHGSSRSVPRLTPGDRGYGAALMRAGRVGAPRLGQGPNGNGTSYSPGRSSADYRVMDIPGGEEGTKATIEKMRDLALGPEGAHNKDVRLLAQKIVAEVPNKDYVGEVGAIFEFMRKNVRYTLDPRGLEYLATPWWTLLVIGQGDCDDHSTAAAALGVSLGHGAAFRTVKGDKERPEEWSHIYPVLGVRQKGKVLWLPIDSTEKGASLGEDPPGAAGLVTRTWVIVPA